MCDCVKNMDEALKAHNSRISISLAVTKDLGLTSYVVVGTEKIDKSKRKPAALVVAGFCPFCGEKRKGGAE